MTAAIVPIPQPKPVPLLGNLPDIDAEKGILGFMELAQHLGPIFRLELLDFLLAEILPHPQPGGYDSCQPKGKFTIQVNVHPVRGPFLYCYCRNFLH